MSPDTLLILFFVVPFGLFTLLVVVSLILGTDRSASITQTITLPYTGTLEPGAQDYDDDMAQMLAIYNRDRAGRGETELTTKDLELQVFAEMGQEQAQSGSCRTTVLDDVELDELVDMTNSDRRRRGLHELTREQVVRLELDGLL